jgi:transposase
MLTRYREQLMGDRTRELVRLELMLEDASIKLSSVASSLKTISARADADRDDQRRNRPAAAGRPGEGKLRRKIPDLAQALTGHFDTNHARLARSMLRRLELVEQALAELDAVLVDAFRPWAHQIELLQTIPGVGPKVAQVIIAETGGDMARFPTAAHWRLGPGWRQRCTSPPDVRPRPGNGTATNGCPGCWSKRLGRSAGCTARTIWPLGMPGC